MTTDDMPKLPTAPKAVIEHIRRFEFGIGASLQGDGRVIVGNTQRRYQSLLGTVAEDLNSKDSHFILELVQNADDNKYAAKVSPSLSFFAESRRLVVVNNETGFLPENVAALCSAGESSKKNKTGYIGEKGIGFKSVFKVTNAPEIHSNGFHFQFNRSDPDNVLGYVVPHWKEPDFPIENGVTTLVLPARPGKPFPTELLKDLEPSLLLFLGKLRRLEVKTPIEHVEYARKDSGPITTLTTDRRLIEGATTREKRTFFRTSTTFDMSDVTEPKRKDVIETDVVLAFPLNSEGEAAPDSSSPVYAFLPVRDFNFPFCIQADFVLTSSRESVHEELDWNIALRDQVAPCFIEALTQFKSKPSLANTYLRFLPESGAVHDPFFRPIVDQLVEALGEAQSVPVEGGKWRKPSQVLLTSAEFRSLFSSADALKLFGAEYPSPDFDASSTQLSRIGCRSLTMAEVVSVFAEHATWFIKKPLEWKARLYAYLASPVRRADYLKVLKDVACIPTADGTFVTPGGDTIFFPLSSDGKSKYDFEHELTVLDDELYNAAVSESAEVQALFQALGVKPDNPYALIREHILARHADEDLGADNKALIGHVRYVRDKLDLYLAQAATLGQTRQAAMQVLKDGLSLGTKEDQDGWLFATPQQLYLSKAYRPDFDIESLLGDKVAPDTLVSDAYVTKRRGATPEEQERELESWRRFFYDVGVNDSPLLNFEGGRAQCSPELKTLLQSTDNGVRRATLECLDRNWHKYKDHQTYSLKISRSSYGEYHTSFKNDLRATLAPTKRKTSVPLPQAYLDDPTIKTILGGNAVFVEADLHNTNFLDATGITYKVDANACLKRLGQIRDKQGGATRDQVRAIYRQLEALWPAEKTAIEAAFSAQPLIMVGSGESTVWVRPSEACWLPTNVKFLDAKHVPLVSQYSEHRTFFTRQLTVPPELPLSKWVDALGMLAEIEDDEERGSFALTIYRRLHRELGPQIKALPDWLQKFASQALFLDHRGHLVKKSKFLFANDSPDYAKLFEDDDSISLLAVSHEHLPGIANLLNRVGIARISSSLSIEPTGDVIGEPDHVLTGKLRDVFGCIARVVYSQSRERFETAVKEQLFEQLRSLEVQVVPELELEVTLAGVTRTAAGDAAPQDNALLLRRNAPSHVDHLAMEVRRILRLLQTQVATISVLLRSLSIKDAEDYLRVTNVSQLPAEEQAMLDGLEPKQVSVIEEAAVAPEEASSAEVSSTSAAEAGDASKENSTPTRNQAETPTAAPASATQASGSPAHSPHGAAATGGGSAPKQPGASQTTTASVAPGQNYAPAVAPSPSPAPTPNPPGQRSGTTPYGVHRGATSPSQGHAPPNAQGNVDSPGLPANEARPGAAVPAFGGGGVPFNGANGSGSGSGSALASPYPPSASPRARDGRGHARPAPGTRPPLEPTKSGRLLSYTEPAKGSSTAQDDEASDPEVKQRRMAIEKAAVDYFLAVASTQWREVQVIQNPTNPGFDIQAIAHDGITEYIEVKGQSGAWTDTGVAVSSRQLQKAEQQRERFWLCVVEYATDESRRQLYLINNPFGLTDQFRFDKGWKGAATVVAARPTFPAVGLFVTIQGQGKACILGVKGSGRLAKIDYQLEDGQKRFNKLFQPNTMTLSVD